jgi:hypothetical protein
MIVMIAIASFRLYVACLVVRHGLLIRPVKPSCGLPRSRPVASGEKAVTLIQCSRSRSVILEQARSSGVVHLYLL